MGIFSSIFNTNNNYQYESEPKRELTPKEEMAKILSTWDFEETKHTLTEVNKVIKFYELVTKDPEVYKDLPEMFRGSSLGATEKYYKYLEKTMDMSTFLKDVKNAAKEPGVHKDIDAEKTYMNLYKDIFGFRRSKDNLEAYDELDHIDKARDIIAKSVNKINDYKNNPFLQDNEKAYEETEIIVKEVMKYPTLIDDIPPQILNEHQNTLINNFYDIIAANHKSDIDSIKSHLDHDLENGISISDDNLAYGKIAKGLDEYLSYVEKGRNEVYEADINMDLSGSSFDKQLDYYEKNIKSSEEDFINLYDFDGDETFLGKADPMFEESYYDEHVNDMSEFYESEYGLTSINPEESAKEIRGYEVIDEEPVGFDYEEYLDDDYMPYTDDMDIESSENLKNGSIIENQERNYIETIERAGIIDVEFDSLVEKLGNKDIIPLEPEVEKDIQDKLAQIIAIKPELYVELPYELSNPFNKENEEFYLHLKEQIKEQGNELSEEITGDIKSFNFNQNRKDEEIINNDIERDEIVEER